VLHHIYFKHTPVVILAIGELFVLKNIFGLRSNTRPSGNADLGHAFTFHQLDPAMVRTAIRQTQR
jgi:hypothetical protein